jgi:hypothetical protein
MYGGTTELFAMVFPVLECIHILEFILLAGSIALIDFRFLIGLSLALIAVHRLVFGRSVYRNTMESAPPQAKPANPLSLPCTCPLG